MDQPACACRLSLTQDGEFVVPLLVFRETLPQWRAHGAFV